MKSDVVSGKAFNKQLKSIISYYRNWLNYSNFSEEEFLTNRELPYELKLDKPMGRMRVSILCGGKTLGEPFLSPSINDNKKFLIDCSLLLFYIAEKLDGNETCRFDITKEFVNLHF